MYTDASRISLIAAASTMLRTMNRLIALSFGVQRAQFEQRTGFTCPRLCLLRPLLRRFFVIVARRSDPTERNTKCERKRRSHGYCYPRQKITPRKPQHTDQPNEGTRAVRPDNRICHGNSKTTHEQHRTTRTQATHLSFPPLLFSFFLLGPNGENKKLLFSGQNIISAVRAFVLSNVHKHSAQIILKKKGG